MNPDKYECMGEYLYGTGRRLKLDAEQGNVVPACDRCPRRAHCWDLHRALVEKSNPVGVALFKARCERDAARGSTPGQVAAETSPPYINK